jgi:hypothetical protein
MKVGRYGQKTEEDLGEHGVARPSRLPKAGAEFVDTAGTTSVQEVMLLSSGKRLCHLNSDF